MADVRKCLPGHPHTLPLPSERTCHSAASHPIPGKAGPSFPGGGWAGRARGSPGVSDSCSVKVGAPLIPGLSSPLRLLLSPRRCARPFIRPCTPTFKTEPGAHSVPLTPAQRPRQRPLTAAEQWGEEKGWVGRVLLLPLPLANQARCMARGEGSIFPPSVLPPLQGAPASWPWGLAPDLGPAELGRALGPEPVNPSCVGPFLPGGGA